jgi:hypothetical protein
MSDELESETFSFSAFKPILLLTCIPAIYLWLTRNITLLALVYSPLAQIMTFVIIFYLWKYLRVTFLMLTLRPAVVLTAEAVVITESGYTIYWKDVMDVYSSSGGGVGMIGLRNHYVTIRVREPDKYFSQITNPFTRFFSYATRNWRETGAFEVDLSLVKGDPDEIYHTILKYYQNNRGF